MIVIYNNNELTMRSGLNNREVLGKKNSILRCANLMVSLISVISCFVI